MTQSKRMAQLISKTGATARGIKRLFNFSYSMLKPVSLNKRSTKRVALMREVFKRDRLLSGKQAVRRGRIFVEGREYLSSDYTRNGLTPVWGCHTQCLAFYEMLKELERKRGISLSPTIFRKDQKFVGLHDEMKIIPHSFVVYEFEGKKYFADPFSNELRILTEEDMLDAKKVPPRPISFQKYKSEKKEFYPMMP